MRKLRLAFFALTLSLFCAASVSNAYAQTLTTLVTFNGTNGEQPESPLLQGLDGNIYGTTLDGGANCNGGCGTVFRMTPAGVLTMLHSFCAQGGYPYCLDGSFPFGGLVQSTNGNFSGTTTGGGIFNTLGYYDALGTIFEIDANGNFTTLYNFAGSPNDGNGPLGLVLGADGNFYGSTFSGGDNCVSGLFGCGNLFKITASGTLTSLYNFCAQTNCTDGSKPLSLMQATDGNFYGTTLNGGVTSAQCGIAFRITPTGKLTPLHSFGSSGEGCFPSSLTLGNDGNFYGTASIGGAHGWGTVFKMTPTGKVTRLYSFCAQTHCADGAHPNGGLVLATDGSFYGTTIGAGGDTGFNYSVIFSITPSGTFTLLHPLNRITEGTAAAGLVQATDGSFYGTTIASSDAGCSNSFCGSVFNLSVGLGPFVKALPNIGKVGRVIAILGNNLTGTSSVTFNGTPATTFTVISPTAIKATVPSGATSGTIEMATPGGILSSNVAFQVVP